MHLKVDGRVIILTGSGAPTDAVTGKKRAGKGSVYLDTANGNAYLQTGLSGSPVWKLVTRAS